MGRERRAYPRHRKRLRARYRVEGEARWRSCFTQDVSVTGLFLKTTAIPAEGQVEIEVELEPGAALALVGRVVHGMRVPQALLRVAKGGFAVMLLQAPPRWYEHCLALASDPAEPAL